MLNSLEWLCYALKWFFIRVIHVFTGKYYLNPNKYGKYILHSFEEGNEELAKKIEEGKPFMYGRYSYAEMDLVVKYITEQKFGICEYGFSKTHALTYRLDCGDKYNGVRKFGSLMCQCIANSDMIGVWGKLYMGDAVINDVIFNTEPYVTTASSLEPYELERPWTRMLKDRKVVIVSPFSDLIEKQYKNRSHIWENDEILPDFKLVAIQSVWFCDELRDERFDNWFTALEYLYNEIIKNDFDIALLGCGPFGFPLAMKIKQYGKSAIHMGGTLQVLFGIKGLRWDSNPSINKFYNDYWVRPGEETKPANVSGLDDGCYW